MEKDEVEELLVGLILEGKVEGKIDQVEQRLELDKKYVISSAPCCGVPPCRKLIHPSLSCRASLARRRYSALDKWADSLENIYGAILSKAQHNALTCEEIREGAKTYKKKRSRELNRRGGVAPPTQEEDERFHPTSAKVS